VIGFLVKHAAYGLGRIQSAAGARAKVLFFAPRQLVEFALNSAPPFERYFLPKGAVCEVAGKRCTAKAGTRGKGWTERHRYELESFDGRLKEASETEIDIVLDAPRPATAEAALTRLEHGGLGSFQRREALLNSYLTALRDGVGVRALLSSRIDLYPHQAYVAGVVLLDHCQRYLLADEVGLGKTIEAGIVIHDLLIRKTDARILILCPGALVEQWLCEIYAKFCGRVFQVPELRSDAGPPPRQAIISFSTALRRKHDLLDAGWDFVVIDEVHHLLGSEPLYGFAYDLARATPGLLLLSALPARHREEEYLQLLALLEPGQHDPRSKQRVERFRDLYSRQNELGTVLRWVRRKLPEVTNGERDPSTLIEKLREVAAWPSLRQDEQLHAMLNHLDGTARSLERDIGPVLHYLGDNYRINRRILRNRRTRLIQDEQITAISRKLERAIYEPDAFEREAIEMAQRLLLSLEERGLDQVLLVALARCILQAAVDPAALGEVLTLDTENEAQGVPLLPNALGGYAVWREELNSLWRKAIDRLDPLHLRHAQRAAETWRDRSQPSARVTALLELLKARHREGSGAKFIVFVGFPSLAERLHNTIHVEFRQRCASLFHFGMRREKKEEEIRAFRRDPQRWLLVCDETGGEGRNFQFADAIIHFDLPWNAALIEQRIGRLDRLGRDSREVVSHALCAAGTPEEGWLACLTEGFEIFTRSISGLEFALREIETEAVRTAIRDDGPTLASFAPEIKTRAEVERTEDESADVLDEASLERNVAGDFRRVQSNPSRQIRLEQAFSAYFMAAASEQKVEGRGSRPVTFCKEANYPEGIVLFQPEDVRDIQLDLPRTESGRIAEHRGTFRRDIAQQRPDLEFFSVGNSLFDTVCGSLFTSPNGRSYAVECQLPGQKGWRGFEFAFRAVARGENLRGQPGLLNQLERVFATGIERVWLNEAGGTAPHSESLFELRVALRTETKGRTWLNLAGDRARAIEERYADPGWEVLVANRLEEARTLAYRAFDERLRVRIDAEHARLKERCRQLQRLKPAGWEEEFDGIQLLRAAIDAWEIELDSLGFFSVNGGLLRT
jgi:ATP-dependent helicase HepA